MPAFRFFVRGCWMLLLGLLLAESALAHEVRVRVLAREAPREVTLRGTGAGLTLTDPSDASVLASLAPGARATLKAEYGMVYVYLPRRVVSVRAVAAEPGAGGTVSVEAGRTARRYEGILTTQNDRGALLLINAVPLEAYVASVTAGEYPFAEPEGVKAQAVLARTYALRSKGKRGAYDVVDHTSDQVYHGADRATDITRAAAAATRGVVLTYDGTLAETVYSSSNGGHIAANESVWSGGPVPYLRARPDPYDRASPHAHWRSTLAAADVHRVLSRAAGFSVTSFEVVARSPEGRVTTVRLTGERRGTLTGSRFRAAISNALGMHALRSTLFDVERRGGSYVFTGRGFGHGVGLSQYGARAQAQAGRSYEDILAFYFQGTALAQATPDLPLGPERPMLASTTRGADLLREAVQTDAPETDAPMEAPAVDTEAHAGPRGWADAFASGTLPEAPRRDRRIAW